MSLQESNHRADLIPYLRQDGATLALSILAVERALCPAMRKRAFRFIRKTVKSGPYAKSWGVIRLGQNFSEHPGYKPLTSYFRDRDAETKTSTGAGTRHLVLLQTTLGRARESD